MDRGAFELVQAGEMALPVGETGEPFIDVEDIADVAAAGVPADIAWLLDYLFSTVLDGRNAYLSDGVQRALGREPRDFSEYVDRTVATGEWKVSV